MVCFRQGSRNASWHGIRGSTSLTSTISATHMNTHHCPMSQVPNNRTANTSPPKSPQKGRNKTQCPMSQLSQLTSTTNHFQNVVSQRSQTICPILHIRKILTHMQVPTVAIQLKLVEPA